MLYNRFNLLRSPHEDTPPHNSGTAPAAPPETAPEEDSEEKADDEIEPEPADAPTATAAPVPLSAFERGKLRALGMSGLVARVEKAEAGEIAANAKLATLTAENARLTAENATHKTATPKLIEAAAAGRENDVSRGVLNELGKIGISADAAPSQVSDDVAATKTRLEFDALSHPERNAFMRNGGKIVG